MYFTSYVLEPAMYYMYEYILMLFHRPAPRLAPYRQLFKSRAFIGILSERCSFSECRSSKWKKSALGVHVILIPGSARLEHLCPNSRRGRALLSVGN